MGEPSPHPTRKEPGAGSNPILQGQVSPELGLVSGLNGHVFVLLTFKKDHPSFLHGQWIEQSQGRLVSGCLNPFCAKDSFVNLARPSVPL